MAKKTIAAVFDSRRKAEEAVTQLSQIGMTDIYIKTAQLLPNFRSTSMAGFPNLSDDIRDYFDFTTVVGSISETCAEEADQIIKEAGGMK